MAGALHRTFDATFLNQVVNDPRVRPWLGGDRKSRLDLQPAIDAGAVALINRDGGFLFVPKGEGVYEVHTQFLPSGRGLAWIAARQAARYMFKEARAEKLITDVPEDNQAALALALKTGFDIASTRNDDGSFSGAAQRIFEMDLTREAFFKAASMWGDAKLQAVERSA